MASEKFDIAKIKEEKKAKKDEQRRIALENKKPAVAAPKPLHRAFRVIPRTKVLSPVIGSFKIMTYNVLAQSLAKRSLFPDSGDYLKWKIRRNMILEEINLYSPDILCLQEVDHYDDFYKKSLSAIGFDMEYFKHETKQHGCLIAFKTAMFSKKSYNIINYDADLSCPPTRATGNIGQMIALQHVQHKDLGIVVGNTHLYWRPASCYERLRQAAIYVSRITQFKNAVQEEFSDVSWNMLLPGDFNTEPTDPCYLAILGQPVTEEHINKLEESRHEASPDKNDEAGGPGTAPEMDQPEATVAPPLDLKTVPEVFGILKNGTTWTSVYSCCGDLDRSVSRPESGEPLFTNYTHCFKSTLDYIFLDKSATRLSPSEVLEIPDTATLEPSLPNCNFGSDHLCLCAKIEFV